MGNMHTWARVTNENVRETFDNTYFIWKQDKGMIGSPGIPKTQKLENENFTAEFFFRHFLKDQKICSYGKNQENL